MTGPSAPPRITVVVTVFNKRSFLEASLGSVLRAAEAATGVDVRVLDDGSTDGSAELAQQLCRGRAQVEVTPSRTIAALRNAGARDAESPLLSFIDADCVVPPAYFETMRDVFTRPDVAATGCRVDYPEEGPWVENVWHRLHSGATSPDGFRPYLNSGNFALRREAFQAVGGFDEQLVTGEDAEIGQRLNDAGYRIYESRRLAVLHLDNPRTLVAFFRKECWHGLGMFGTVRLTSVDRPTAMMVAHFICLVGAGSVLLAPVGILARAAAGVALAFLVPALTAGYRMWRARRLSPLLPSVVLYQVYYLARLTALVQIGWDRMRLDREHSEERVEGLKR